MAESSAGSQGLPPAARVSGADACMADLQKNKTSINDLYAQISALQCQNKMLDNQAGQSGTVEPEFKKMRKQIEETELNLLASSERVKEQDKIYSRAHRKLQHQLEDQQADITYLMKKTANTGKDRVHDDDQPRRGDQRAESSGAGKDCRFLTVDPAKAAEDLGNVHLP